MRSSARAVAFWTLLHAGAAGAVEDREAPTAPVVPVDRFATPALALDVSTGTDAPAGHAAFGLTWDASRYLAASFAAGMHVEGRFRRRRWALGMRGRLPVNRAFALDAGVSLSWADGHGEEESGRDDAGLLWSFQRYWEKAYRINPEIGVSYRPTSRFNLRAFAGIGFPLEAGTCTYSTASGAMTGCDSPPVPAELLERHRRFPYVGVSAGLGFLRFGPAPPDWGGFPAAKSPRWYGQPMLVADIATSAIVPFTLANRSPGDSNALPFIIWGADVATAFATHALHDHPVKAAGSLALRLGLVAAGWRIGEEGPDPFWAALGAGVGWLVSVLIDDIALARD